jgi:hypothetical protein
MAGAWLKEMLARASILFLVGWAAREVEYLPRLSQHYKSQHDANYSFQVSVRLKSLSPCKNNVLTSTS